MNGTFTSYAAVLMMPAGQVAQQQRTIRGTTRRAIRGTIRRAIRGTIRRAIRGTIRRAIH